MYIKESLPCGSEDEEDYPIKTRSQIMLGNEKLYSLKEYSPVLSENLEIELVKPVEVPT